MRLPRAANRFSGCEGFGMQNLDSIIVELFESNQMKTQQLEESNYQQEMSMDFGEKLPGFSQLIDRNYDDAQMMLAGELTSTSGCPVDPATYLPTPQQHVLQLIDSISYDDVGSPPAVSPGSDCWSEPPSPRSPLSPRSPRSPNVDTIPFHVLQENPSSSPERSVSPDSLLTPPSPALLPATLISVSKRSRKMGPGSWSSQSRLKQSPELIKNYRIPRRSRRTCPQLWRFLMSILENPVKYGQLICWEDETRGIFRIIQSQKVAKLWGETRKQCKQITYEHMSRGIRHYYRQQLMSRTDKRLVYKFEQRAIDLWKKQSA